MSVEPQEERNITGQISDVREWLVRLDTKLDYLNEVKTTADRADKNADAALQKAEDNAQDIVEVRQDLADTKTEWGEKNRWAWGFVFLALITLGGALITVLLT